MEMGLFSAFDSSPMNFIILMFVFILPQPFWGFPSRFLFMILSMFFYMNKEFLILLGKNISGGVSLYIVFFLYIINFNFLGMFPFIFSITSQFNFNLFFSLIYFFIYFLFGWLKFPNWMLCHMTPSGSPSILAPFLVLIELISSSIRPFTLSIRLSANIVSGHVLMEIILGPSENFSFFMIAFFIIVLPILVLELVVCFVQAFVISSLSSLYLSDSMPH